MIMNREEWISYYESINGHKPSVLEVAKAEKDVQLELPLLPLNGRYHHNCKYLCGIAVFHLQKPTPSDNRDEPEYGDE